jgi:ATP/maltotriose-dependent transcriptional regulator MalT
MKRKLIIFIAAIFIFSCSTKPKNLGDIYTIRTQTEKEFSIANKEAGRGNYEIAQGLLEECRRKAISVDDAGLIIRCGLSLGNVLFSLGKDNALSDLEKTVQLAQKHGDKELLSISKIYYERCMLLSGKVQPQTALDNVTREAANIKNDQLYIAFSWQVKGLAYRALNSYKEAENAFKQSLAIHEKEKYLENASYDWYNIASIRSTTGNTQGAVQALEEAIKLDRRVENSWALAANWRAMGDVQRKAGNNQAANEAYLRSKEIFNALGKSSDAAEIDKRMEN